MRWQVICCYQIVRRLNPLRIEGGKHRRVIFHVEPVTHLMPSYCFSSCDLGLLIEFLLRCRRGFCCSLLNREPNFTYLLEGVILYDRLRSFIN